jgi:hypothetical protein
LRRHAGLGTDLQNKNASRFSTIRGNTRPGIGPALSLL